MTKLGELVRAELESEIRSNFAFWRFIPSSSVRKSVALLDADKQGDAIRLLHQAAETVVRRAEDPVGGSRIVSAGLTCWLEKTSRPWAFGSTDGEWHFTGCRDRRDLAKRLLAFRGAPQAAAMVGAGRMLEHFKDVKDEELNAALEWRPIRKRPLIAALKAGLARFDFQELPADVGETRLLIPCAKSRLELRLELRSGTLLYEMSGFFENPVARLTYEGLCAIGIGEWDLLAETDVETACETLVEVVRRIVSWKNELS